MEACVSVSIPQSHLDLIAGPVHALLTTIAPDGQPENTVVWCSWDGEHVLVNTADGRRKHENARRNPLVALAAIDPNDPYRWIDVRGRVAAIVPDEGNANIYAHARLYADVAEGEAYTPPEWPRNQVRVIIKIKPTRVVAFPND